MYPEDLIAPMREELAQAGFEATKTAEQVENRINEKGTTLVMVNSVCGCAAGSARPAVRMAVATDKKPDRLITVFAGNDVDAVNKAREMMAPFPPSSPAIAMFKDGELVHMIERHHIEGRTAEAISNNLQEAFAEFC